MIYYICSYIFDTFFYTLAKYFKSKRCAFKTRSLVFNVRWNHTFIFVLTWNQVLDKLCFTCVVNVQTQRDGDLDVTSCSWLISWCLVYTWLMR